MDYLLELSSINWNIQANVKQGYIIINGIDSEATIIVRNINGKNETQILPQYYADRSEFKRIAVGVSLILEEATTKL